MVNAEKAVAGLVYASVVLGVFFLYVLYGFTSIAGFPSFLFPSIFGGEILWVICAVAVTRRVRWAPYMALVLALITLVLSLSQPTHYSFAESGQIEAFLVFSIGALIQLALIAAVSVFLLRDRRG